MLKYFCPLVTLYKLLIYHEIKGKFCYSCISKNRGVQYNLNEALWAGFCSFV